MAKLINILQTKQEINVPSSLITKLYNMIIRAENYSEQTYANNSRLDGTISLYHPTYKEYVDKIREAFPLLNVVNTDFYMLFKDDYVKQKMLDYMLSKGVGDGEGITYDDASNISITGLPSFQSDTNIEYFDELVNFTRINTLAISAFYNCTNLKSINIQNITSAGGWAFRGCSSLESITLGPLSTIEEQMFRDCTNLKTVNHNGSLRTIKGWAFSGDTLLENIDLSTCTSIGGNAFNGCLSLTTIDVSQCTSIGDNAFRSCSSLTGEINLSQCTSIGGFGFFGCSNVDNFTGLTNVTSIGNQAFQNCTKIETISLGNITKIPSNCFQGCSKLKSVNYTGTVTSIEGNAFYGCTSLTTINTSNCTSIGQMAFLGCSSLTSIDTSHCTSIGAAALQSCTGLTTLNLSNCTSFGQQALAGCSGLTTIIFSPNFTEMPNNFMNGCGYIQNIDLSHILSFNGMRNCTFDHVDLNPNITRLTGFDYVTVNSELVIPASVTYIHGFQFAKIPSLRFQTSTPPEAPASAFHNLNVQTIYIPRGSLEAYKNAAGDWSRYSSGNKYVEYDL